MSEPGGATIPGGVEVAVTGAIVVGTAEFGSAGSVVAETEGTGVECFCAAIAAAAVAVGAPHPIANAAHGTIARAIHPSRTRISFLSFVVLGQASLARNG